MKLNFYNVWAAYKSHNTLQDIPTQVYENKDTLRKNWVGRVGDNPNMLLGKMVHIVCEINA